MRRLASSALVCAALGIATAAGAQPDAAQVRKAASEFDEGTRAYKAEEYEEAASRFEAADQAVPSPAALRLAMRSRAEAGQGSRAATLAGLALARYPKDDKTAELARAIIEAHGPDLHRVRVSCASPCVLAVGTRSIHGAHTTRWELYLDPGKHQIAASFFGGVSGGRVLIEASEGGESSMRFEPNEEPDDGPNAVVAPPPPTDGWGEDPKPDDVPPDDPAGPDEAEDGSGLHPAFFVAGLVATAGLGGVTIWSGIDTQNNPGEDVVREACVGQGEDCPEYQDGVDRQNRTNILIGATAGTAALTLLVGTLLTDWGGSSDDDDDAAARVRVLPSVSPAPQGHAVVTMSARGRF